MTVTETMTNQNKNSNGTNQYSLFLPFIVRLSLQFPLQRIDEETFHDLVDPIVDSASDPSFPKFALYLLRKLADMSVLDLISQICFLSYNFIYRGHIE